MTQGGNARFDELIQQGRERGFLTFAEVSDALAAKGASSPLNIQRLLRQIESAGVRLVERATQTETSGRSSSRSTRGGANETIQSYLDWIGSVSLLTREGEVELARQIEKGRNVIWATFLASKIKAPAAGSYSHLTLPTIYFV